MMTTNEKRVQDAVKNQFYPEKNEETRELTKGP
jgi:hypothetical protein